MQKPADAGVAAQTCEPRGVPRVRFGRTEPDAEIARQVGYDSQSKFTAAFRNYAGRLPKECRRVHVK